jgi:hypothetical protein
MAMLSIPVALHPARIVASVLLRRLISYICVKKCKVADESARIGLRLDFDGAGQRARTMGGVGC